MSWESVKGFCRRRTQQLKESFQGAPKTEDAEFDAFHAKAEVVVGAAERMSLRLAGVMRDLTDFIQQYELLFIDLSTISTGDHGGAELQGMDKKVELAAQDYKQKFALLEAAIKQVLGELQRFNMEASQVEGLLDDRKAKMLEYDFFRNKLVALRAAPPADTTRIPRNEGRELDWQRAYEESNTQAKKLFQHLIQSGGEIIAQGATVLTVDVSKFFGEVSKTQRVLFLGNRLADGAQAAAASVHNAAVSAVQQVAGQATAVAAGAAVAVHATGNQGSKRFFLADDPFKTT